MAWIAPALPASPSNGPFEHSPAKTGRQDIFSGLHCLLGLPAQFVWPKTHLGPSWCLGVGSLDLESNTPKVYIYRLGVNSEGKL